MGFQEVQKLLLKYNVELETHSIMATLTVDNVKEAAALLTVVKSMGVCAYVYIPKVGLCDDV